MKNTKSEYEQKHNSITSNKEYPHQTNSRNKQIQEGRGTPYDAISPRYFCLPAELEESLRPLVEGVDPSLLDQYRWAVHSITFNLLTDRRFDEDDFVPLKIAFLRKILVADNVTPILKDLTRWGFIESNESWRSGHFSKGYRCTERYRTGRIIELAITDPRLNRKVERIRQEHLQEIHALPEGYGHVFRSLSALSVDLEGAEAHIAQTYPQDSRKSNARRVALAYIARSEYWMTVGQKGKRAHHNLSNLASDLRPFLKLDGHPIQQIDIANSQPFIMHLLFRGEVADERERNEMENLVLQGNFYKRLNISGSEYEFFKKRVFRELLFKKGNYTSNMEVLFRSIFPSYASAIERRAKATKESLAAHLQQEESNVIYDAVKRFARHTHGRVPILTIHDSLVAPPSHIQAAYEALVAAFQERHGLVPLLRFK